MTTDDHFRFIQAREREFDLSSQMADSPDDESLWSSWRLAAATVDALVDNLDLSDDDIHNFDLQIQALRSQRPQH